MLLYRRHQEPVFRFALYLSGSREIAEEVTQELFLGLLEEHERYVASLGALQAYLIGAARNLIRQRSRRTAREEPHRQVTDPAAPPLDRLVREEELDSLRSAIQSLPLNYREVVVLCDMEELSYEEAALRLGCAVGTVRSRLHRARAILLAKMQRQTGQKRERCPA